MRRLRYLALVAITILVAVIGVSDLVSHSQHNAAPAVSATQPGVDAPWAPPHMSPAPSSGQSEVPTSTGTPSDFA